jgi:proline iminopeptidase
MKCTPIPAFAIVLVFLSSTLVSCAGGESPPAEPKTPQPALEQRESIHDRVVHIEPDLITEIPEVARFCDELGLTAHRINVGDAELFVEEEGEGVPLVLINGGPGGTHHYFHPWFGRAAEYSRVIYYDQRGCGLSDFEPGEDGYSVYQAVDDLDALRQALGIEKWVVLGYSYGGFLAQFYTVNHPANVAGLVLLGASPGMPVDLGPSRQGDFLSDEERNRRTEIRGQLQQLSRETDIPAREYTQLLVYNNFINGDWKRQNFYKPSPERMAQGALYEWDHDGNFNGAMGDSMGGIDLTGAFENNPIPTLILEGRWDLTWSEAKPAILHGNHPQATLVMFENAGHGIYDEETDRFFGVLEDFVRNLPEVSPPAITAYESTLAVWGEERTAAPEYALRSAGWGWNSSRELAAGYSRDWLEEFDEARSFLRLGFALYDVEDYDEARIVFERMESIAAAAGDPGYEAVALIWQGHMLDLMDRRDEAILAYRRVVDMNLEDTWSHGQYGLSYSLSPYSRERIESPFKRIDNRDSS